MQFIQNFKDVLRFKQLSEKDNQLCFYCEGKNYWPHLAPIVYQLLDTSDVTVNYVSSDKTDPALQIDHPQLNTYNIGSGFLRNYFFDNLSSKLVVMTMPDLDQYQVKKSSKVGKYIYIHHSLVSHHMVYRPKAFDAFDVIFCGGPHHKIEIEAMCQEWGMSKKQLIDHGYGRLDSILHNKKQRVENKVSKIVVAPSWGVNGTIELIGEKLIDELMTMPFEVIFRPHPQTVKFSKEIVDRIIKKHESNERFTFEFGVASEASLHQSDLMISDWSGAAFDYAFALLKPVLFVDVPKKAQNPNHEKLSVIPFEVQSREQIGVIQDMSLTHMRSKIECLLNDSVNWAKRIESYRNQNVFNIGESGGIGSKKILEFLCLD